MTQEIKLNLSKPHEHDMYDHDCRYLGNDAYACGHLNNECTHEDDVGGECGCCSGKCQE